MLRGHKIRKIKGKTYYIDTGESTVDNWKNRPCGICKKQFTKEGHDPCLGTLPNVMNACCGHGVIKDAYIQLGHKDYNSKPNKFTYRGQEALELIKKLKQE